MTKPIRLKIGDKVLVSKVISLYFWTPDMKRSLNKKYVVIDIGTTDGYKGYIRLDNGYWYKREELRKLK